MVAAAAGTAQAARRTTRRRSRRLDECQAAGGREEGEGGRRALNALHRVGGNRAGPGADGSWRRPSTTRTSCPSRLPGDGPRVGTRQQVTVLQGDTGCSKTTQVPQFVLEEAAAAGHHVSIVHHGWNYTRSLATRSHPHPHPHHPHPHPHPRLALALALDRCARSRGASQRWARQRVAAERGEPLGRSGETTPRAERPRLRPRACAHARARTRTRRRWATRSGSRTSRRPRPASSSARRASSAPPRGGPDPKGTTRALAAEVHERSVESDFLLMVLRDTLRDRGPTCAWCSCRPRSTRTSSPPLCHPQGCPRRALRRAPPAAPPPPPARPHRRRLRGSPKRRRRQRRRRRRRPPRRRRRQRTNDREGRRAAIAPAMSSDCRRSQDDREPGRRHAERAVDPRAGAHVPGDDLPPREVLQITRHHVRNNVDWAQGEAGRGLWHPGCVARTATRMA